MDVGRITGQAGASAAPGLPRLPRHTGIDIFDAIVPNQSRRPCAQMLGMVGLRLCADTMTDRVLHGMMQSLLAAMIAVPLGMLIGLQLLTIQIIGAVGLALYTMFHPDGFLYTAPN